MIPKNIKLELRAISINLSPTMPNTILRVYPTGEIAGIMSDTHWIGYAFFEENFSQQEIEHILSQVEILKATLASLKEKEVIL